MTVVLIGFRIWGKGVNLQQAYARLREANGRRAVKGLVLAYACTDKDVYVSEDSMICYGLNAKLHHLGTLPR